MKSLDKSVKRQEWTATIEAWKASGFSIKKWCRDNKIKETAFHYWKRTLVSSAQPPFLELPKETVNRIEMEVDGVKIYVDGDFDETTLIRCLKILRKPLC